MIAEEGEANRLGIWPGTGPGIKAGIGAALQSPGHQRFEGLAAELLAEDDQERLLGLDGLAEGEVGGDRIGAAQIIWQSAITLGRQPQRGLGLPFQLDGPVVGHIESGAVQAHVGAQIPGQERMLLGGIAANQQNRQRRGRLAQTGRPARMPGESPRKSRVIRAALMVDVVGAENRPREFL